MCKFDYSVPFKFVQIFNKKQLSLFLNNSMPLFLIIYYLHDNYQYLHRVLGVNLNTFYLFLAEGSVQVLTWLFCSVLIKVIVKVTLRGDEDFFDLFEI